MPASAGSNQISKNPDAPTATVGSVAFTTIDVSGNPVPGITPESLEVRLGGKTVRAEAVQPLGGEPLVFSMLVDVSGSTRRFADREIAAASELFRELASEGGKGYLVVFGEKPAGANRFVNRETVAGALNHFPPESRHGGTALYDALFYVLTRQFGPAALPAGSRRAIFLLSDGGDDLSRRSQDAVVKVAQTEQIAIFSVGFSRDASNEKTPEEGEARQNLRTLSRQTGGLIVFLDDPNDPISHLIHLADQQYLLSFDCPSLKSGKLYRLSIKTREHAVRISAPSKWFLR